MENTSANVNCARKASGTQGMQQKKISLIEKGYSSLFRSVSSEQCN